MLLCHKQQRARNGYQQQQVDKKLLQREADVVVVHQIGGKRAEVVAEEQVVDRAGSAHNKHYSLKNNLCLVGEQPVENSEPENEHSRSRKEGAHDVPNGVQVGSHYEELLRRSGDNRRGNENARQNREENRGKSEQLFVGLGSEFTRSIVCFLLDESDEKRDRKQSAYTLKDEQFFDDSRKEEVYNAENHQRAADAQQHNFQHLLGILDLVEDGLNKREQVVERPVKYKSRGRVVEEHKEERRHTVKLDLGFERVSLGEDNG